MIQTDMVEEAKLETASVLSGEWLMEQIENAATLAKATLPVNPAVIASRILRSRDIELSVDVLEMNAEQAKVERLLAHIEWTTSGFRLPPRVTIGIARRLFQGLSNRNAEKPNGHSDTDFCPNCGATFERGDHCGCPDE